MKTRAQTTNVLKRLSLRKDVRVERACDAYEVSVVLPGAESDGGGIGFDPRFDGLGRRGVTRRDAKASASTSMDTAHRVLRMTHGIAEGVSELADAYPLECNFDALNGVSFTKGCYMGQINGKDYSLPMIQEVQKESPAANAGLQSGDKISFINDKQIESINEVSTLIAASSGDIKITITRNNQLLDFVIQPVLKDSKDALGNNMQRKMIGIKIVPYQNKVDRKRLGPAKAIYYALMETYNTISLTLGYLGNVIVGSASPDQLGGPIKIAQITGQVADYGFVPFLSIMAYISISLGLINLFPIPLLDGGHLFFYLIEFIRGKPLNEQIQEYFYRFGFFILFTLMFFATFNDLKGLGLF